MRKLCCTFAALALVFCFTTAQAEEKEKKEDDKDVTLKGVIQCNKCHLKKTAKCETVIVVKKEGKDVVYIFDAAAHKKHHSKVCEDKLEGEVKGKVKKDGEKLIITVSDVTFK